MPVSAGSAITRFSMRPTRSISIAEVAQRAYPILPMRRLLQDGYDLTEHLKIHTKDFSSRRGLLGQVAQRRKLLDYLKAKDQDRYRELISRLGLRR